MARKNKRERNARLLAVILVVYLVIVVALVLLNGRPEITGGMSFDHADVIFVGGDLPETNATTGELCKAIGVSECNWESVDTACQEIDLQCVQYFVGDNKVVSIAIDGHEIIADFTK